MPASVKHLSDKKLNLTSLLARWKDGLYYTAAIVRCDKTNKRCLVCFEDGSEVWVNNRDVHIQLSLEQLNEDEDIVCCVCDDGSSEAPNEIILCDVCQQGYHQKCHNPPVDSSKIDETDDTSDHKDWFCATCSYILNQSNRAKLSAEAQQQQQQKKPQQQQQAPPQLKPKSKSPPEPQPQPKSLQPEQPKQPQQQKSQSQSQQQVSPQPPQKQLAKPKPQPVAPQLLAQQTTAAAVAAVITTPTPSSQQQQQQAPTTTSPVKASANNVQKPTPYYPLSNQARAVASSSTAALASMTASSALVVGSSAGRTKQDLVNQSNRSSQRQRPQPSGTEVISPPVKHAVRKSSVNFVAPVRQSALPTATRSVLPSTPPAPSSPRTPNLIANTAITSPHPVPRNIINSGINDGVHNNDGSHDRQPQLTILGPPMKKLATWSMSTQGLIITPPVSVKSSDRSKDSPSITSNLDIAANNNCKQSPKAESKISVISSSSSSSSHPPTSGNAGNTSIIITANSVQPTVIVSAESKQTGQKLT